MYKKQMIFQRIVCVAMLIAAALVFVYSLGLMTDLYDGLYLTMMDPDDIESTWVEGSTIFYEMQGYSMETHDFTGENFCSEFTVVSIGVILVSLILFITNTHSRRKYYIGNYFATVLSVICNIAVSVWGVAKIAAYKEQYLQIDFEGLQSFSEMWNTPFIESTFWFDAAYFVFGFLLLITVLLIVNLILKIIMMKEEKRLIGSRKDVAV